MSMLLHHGMVLSIYQWGFFYFYYGVALGFDTESLIFNTLIIKTLLQDLPSLQIHYFKRSKSNLISNVFFCFAITTFVFMSMLLHHGMVLSIYQRGFITFIMVLL